MPHNPPEVVLRLWPRALVFTAVGHVVVHDIYEFSALPGLMGSIEKSTRRTERATRYAPRCCDSIMPESRFSLLLPGDRTATSFVFVCDSLTGLMAKLFPHD